MRHGAKGADIENVGFPCPTRRARSTRHTEPQRNSLCNKQVCHPPTHTASLGPWVQARRYLPLARIGQGLGAVNNLGGLETGHCNMSVHESCLAGMRNDCENLDSQHSACRSPAQPPPPLPLDTTLQPPDRLLRSTMCIVPSWPPPPHAVVALLNWPLARPNVASANGPRIT